MRAYDVDRKALVYDKIKPAMETQMGKNVVVFDQVNTKVDAVLEVINQFDSNFDPVHPFKLGPLLIFRNQLQPFEKQVH
jgi:hypothetical protein